MKYGEFINNGRTFCINTPLTPKTWSNPLFNDGYYTDISQTLQGSGNYIKNNNLQTFTTGYRHFYILDRADNEFFCPCYLPLHSSLDSFFCEHSLGHSAIKSVSRKTASEITVFVPVKGDYEIWSINITNQSDEEKTYSLFSAVPLKGRSPMEGFCRCIKNDGILYNYSFPYHVFYEEKEKLDNEKAYYFMMSDTDIHSFDCSAQRFYGCDDSTEIPTALKNGECSNTDAEGEKFIAAIENRFTLEKNESKTINIIIGVAVNIDEIYKIKNDICNPIAIKDAFYKLEHLWNERCKSFIIETPDKNLDYLMNYWLKKQSVLITRLNRNSNYVPVRNQLQDALGYSLIEPDTALEYALKVLRRQMKNGFIQQWYMTDGSKPVKLALLKHGDGPLWLMICIMEIIEQCGKAEIYDRSEGYIDSEEKESIYRHLMKAAKYMFQELRGQRGLCLMLDGDWTDPINGAGRLGKGESTWSTMALLYCLKRLIGISTRKKEVENVTKLKECVRVLHSAINDHCWDGEWYVAGFNDSGNPFGSHADKEGQVFLNAQTWAVISGCAEGERLKSVLKTINKMETPFGPLLLTPAFTEWNPVWGRLSIKHPGTSENGSVYCHASMFKAFGDCMLKDGDGAYRTILQTLPVNPENPPEKNLQIPLFVPNYYFGLKNSDNFGQSSLHYPTGTAAWLMWIMLEFILGVKATLDGIKIQPLLPKGWQNVKVTRKFLDKYYEFEITD